MKRSLGLGALALFLGGAALAACTGPQGLPGKDGKDGTSATGGTGGTGATLAPSVSAVSPSFAYLGRTVDLTVAGNGTNWSSTTTVAFADTNIKVNKVTAASATGLVVNVTVGSGAAVAATDVTVTDGSNMEVYKGAFQVKAPLSVATDQTGGVPQGGFANVDAQMLDVSTPLDPNTAAVTLSSTDVNLAGSPSVGDFSAVVLVAADVLATAGESIDLTVSSGPTGSAVTSLAKGAFKVATRAPTTLSPTAGGSGMINSTSDSSLYQFTPSSASTTFVQYNVASADGGGVIGIALTKSGKYKDALGGFGVRFGQASSSTDVTYLVATDGGSFFANPPPYSFTLDVTATACTGVTEQTTAHGAVGVTQALATLPALVTGDLGDGSGEDWYQITVAGASTASPKTIHVATGGDLLSDISVNVIDPDKSTVDGSDAADDAHKDVVVSATTNGTYYIQLTAGGNYDSTHSSYALFVEVK